MWYVYILYSYKYKAFYKGLTRNLDNRLKRHFAGKEQTTKKMLPLELLHVELCKSRVEARKLEKFFKSGYGREIIIELFSHAGVAKLADAQS